MHALFDLDSIPAGTYNERLLAWLNNYLGASYASLPEAKQAYAEDSGFYNWDSISVWDLTGIITGPGAGTGEGQGLLLALTAS